MVRLPDSEKNFDDPFRQNTGVSPRVTHRRTDILSRHSPRYAYASRGKMNRFCCKLA